VHGVGAQDDKIGAGRFKRTSRIRKARACRIPVVGVLQLLDFGEVDAVQHDPRGMQTPELAPDRLVDDPVVGPGGHPKSPSCGHLKIPHP